jgi:hypothetical protein
MLISNLLKKLRVKFCVFLIPILNFLRKKFIFALISIFLNFECKCTQGGSKKRKTFFYKSVLEFN